MKSLLTWTQRRLPRLFRKLSNRQNFHLKAEMFSFHSKYFVYRELKRAPQKLSFCFKCPDTGTVRILGNILYNSSDGKLWGLSLALNPRTYKEGGGGAFVATPYPSEVFLSFFLEDKTSAPDVFGSCSFIPHAHFETSSVMVSFYGYEIWRHDWVAGGQAIFEWKYRFFSVSFDSKSISCG